MSSAAPRVRIEELRLENFRAFENARLSLTDMTFLVGRNGAGKSSLLDAVEFMREAVTDNLPNALARRDGLHGILRRGAGTDASVGVSVVMTATLVGRAVRMLYGFRLSDSGRTIEEVLRVPQATSQGFHRRGTAFETGVRGVDPRVMPERLILPAIVSTELWKLVFDALAGMRAYEIVPQVMASPAPIRNQTSLEKNGANAGDVLEEVRSRPEAYRSIVETLGVLTKDVIGVEGRTVIGQRVLYFTQQRDAEHTDAFSAPEVSQGTLRALGLLLSLYQSPEPSLLLIDEIEDSIHPRAIQALLEEVEITAERFPIVLTTHSPEVLGLRQVMADRTRIVQWSQGVSRLYPLSEGSKASVDPVNTVGELLRYNALWPSDTPETFAGDLLEIGP
ncbi:ATP-binding protein [Polyangium sp. 15x6]|uniref:AAA family ATPase n=1 Tax=Polyangium sp. 15x6 TaxID=3042687 RepID=UPI00249BD0A6|nr:ATP-binding protein [Polyangium sp. 15x6]MDI3291593.1 AAA family ATPase [Polyangium sp. 15x6]